MSKKKNTVRYCECGAPLPADEPKAKLCQACRKRRLEEQRAEHRSLSVEDEARRNGEMNIHGMGHIRTVREVNQIANALGISYGNTVSRGYDKKPGKMVPVYAENAGTVVSIRPGKRIGRDPFDGKTVKTCSVLKNGKTVEVNYCHIIGIAVSEGQNFSQGDLVGYIWNEGVENGGQEAGENM